MSLPADHIVAAVRKPGACWDVLAFIGSLDVGGCERHLATVYPRLAASGLKVGIVTFKRGGVLENEVRAGGVDVLCVTRLPQRKMRPFNTIRAIIANYMPVIDIARLLLSGRVGVMHFFLPGAYIFGGTGALLARFRHCVMSRRSLNNYQAKRPLATRFEHFLHPRMKLLTANAQAPMAQLVGEGAPAERTILLHNGVDIEPLDSAPDRDTARHDLGIAPNQLVLAIVANLIPYKGHADLIEALGRLAPNIKVDWVLLVAGRDDGPGVALKQRAAALGIAQNIRWLGLVGDVPAIWRAADIGVLSSHQEGLPNSLLEAMAMGVPMVATRVGGVTDIATDDVDALLVSPQASDELAAALRRLVDDSELRSRIGRAAKRRVRESFSLEACVDAYRKLYGLMLHRPVLSGAEIAQRFRSRTDKGSAAIAARPDMTDSR